MIDPIGTKSVSASDLRTDSAPADAKVVKIADVAGSKAATAQNSTSTVSLGASEAVKTMAASPPVDTDRVATIRKAVQNGTFPIYPTTIADRLIAFEQGWRGQ